MTESFQQLFEQSLASQQIKPGQILTGTIVDMNDDVVIVSVGLKSEAVIPAEQFRNENGQVDVIVQVSIAESAAIQNHRVVEQVTVAVLGGLQLPEELPEQRDMVLIDLRFPRHQLGVVNVM